METIERLNNAGDNYERCSLYGKSCRGSSVGEKVEIIEPLNNAGDNHKCCSLYGKSCRGSSRLEELPYDPEIPRLYIYIWKKSGTLIDIIIPMITAALFI